MAKREVFYIVIGIVDAGPIELPGKAVGMTLVYESEDDIKEDLGSDVEWIVVETPDEGMNA